MRSSAAVQSDTIWLETRNYEVVALNQGLVGHLPELAKVLRHGVPAYPDSSRQNFFGVEVKSGWAYVHVHDEAQTVYLVAFASTRL